jgi:hypothetical protein
MLETTLPRKRLETTNFKKNYNKQGKIKDWWAIHSHSLRLFYTERRPTGLSILFKCGKASINELTMHFFSLLGLSCLPRYTTAFSWNQCQDMCVISLYYKALQYGFPQWSINRFLTAFNALTSCNQFTDLQEKLLSYPQITDLVVMPVLTPAFFINIVIITLTQ